MKNLTSGTEQSNDSVNVRHGNNRSVCRRDLSQPREERKAAQNMAEQLQLMEQHIARIPEIDFQRRNQIRTAIATGTYAIDPVSIAGKFLQFEKALYGKD